MEEFGSLFSFIALAGLLVMLAILFGPSLYSSCQNWKIRCGLERLPVPWTKQAIPSLFRERNNGGREYRKEVRQ